MPEREDVEFQIELLRIQIQNEIFTEFFVALIAVSFAGLLSLRISLAVTGQYNLWVAVSQVVSLVMIVMVAFVHWRRADRRINEQIENLRRRFSE